MNTPADSATRPLDGPTALIADAFDAQARHRGPKYLSLHGAVTDLVTQGALPPGAQLPADDDIAAALGISLGTVQKTMNALRDDGMLDRRQGHGTFIRDPALGDHDVWHFRFLDDTGGGFLPLSARALAVERVAPGGAWSTYMPAASAFVRIVRRIDVGGAFAIISTFYFDGDRFGGLADLPLGDLDRVVLRNILVERYNVRTVTAQQLLACKDLPSADRVLMGDGATESGIILETFGVDAEERPIYYQRVVIPQTGRKLVLDPST